MCLAHSYKFIRPAGYCIRSHGCCCWGAEQTPKTHFLVIPHNEAVLRAEMEDSVACPVVTNEARQQIPVISRGIVYGNTARYFGFHREDGHTHEWKLYVRPYVEGTDLSQFIRKVSTFFERFSEQSIAAFHGS